MTILINGDAVDVTGPLTLTALLAQLSIDPRRVAVEHNLNVVKRANYDSTEIRDGDQVEIVNFVGGGGEAMTASDDLVIAGRVFTSRLIVGTGKYSSFSMMRRAHEASGADMVTVAVRRVNLTDRSKESLLDYIDASRIALLPNTAGCYSAEDAIRTARLGREAGLSHWVKLEVIGDEKTLFPDNEELVAATKVLVKEGFIVLPYTTDDPVVCRKLEDAGAAAIMPLGAPIGSGLGIQNLNNLRIIREFARVPLIVDAGVGTASDATIAMELGADGVLMNTAIAEAQDPVAMAESMKLAVQSGRLAYRAGRMPRRAYASASSPLAGTLR
jgi:thiazole synthase